MIASGNRINVPTGLTRIRKEESGACQAAPLSGRLSMCHISMSESNCLTQWLLPPDCGYPRRFAHETFGQYVCIASIGCIYARFCGSHKSLVNDVLLRELSTAVIILRSNDESRPNKSHSNGDRS